MPSGKVARALGTNEQVVEQVYGHHLPEHLRDVVETVSGTGRHGLAIGHRGASDEQARNRSPDNLRKRRPDSAPDGPLCLFPCAVAPRPGNAYPFHGNG